MLVVGLAPLWQTLHKAASALLLFERRLLGTVEGDGKAGTN